MLQPPTALTPDLEPDAENGSGDAALEELTQEPRGEAPQPAAIS